MKSKHGKHRYKDAPSPQGLHQELARERPRERKSLGGRERESARESVRERKEAWENVIERETRSDREKATVTRPGLIFELGVTFTVHVEQHQQEHEPSDYRDCVSSKAH